MDGLTCVKKIREKEESGEFIAHIPVIAVTANARQEMIDEYVAGGMVGFPSSSIFEVGH